MNQPDKRFGVIPSMMAWAETAAKEHRIAREEVDGWAVLSNQRACAAIASGTFTEEIIPVPVTRPKGDAVLFSQDERPRADTDMNALAKLKPVMGGVCTAGNSCGENDGASACVIMSEEKAEELKLQPLAYLKGFAFSGSDPRYAWRAATGAVKNVLQKTGLSLKDMDLIEVHEAFAAQALANFRELGLTEKEYDRINVNGSCVALGHPLGATGARILTTLTHEMRRRGARYGLIAMCGGGGMGVAAILERV
jgi:acetyl-CoA C-acetyltransferase